MYTLTQIWTPGDNNNVICSYRGTPRLDPRLVQLKKIQAQRSTAGLIRASLEIYHASQTRQAGQRRLCVSLLRLAVPITTNGTVAQWIASTYPLHSKQSHCRSSQTGSLISGLLVPWLEQKHDRRGDPDQIRMAMRHVDLDV